MTIHSILNGGQGSFSATHWSVVIAAGAATSDSHRRRALEELARTYWFPLYAFVRRRGLSPDAAEDLTQDFFARLLEKQSLTQVDRTKGKFRSFLLASLKNFLANEYDKAQTRKRGGQSAVIAIDSLSAEARYALEPVDTITPERVFEQRWAWAVLDRVLQLLRERYEADGQGALFDAIKGTLTGRPEAGDYAEIGLTLNMQTGSIAVATHRLRRRYRQLLRDEIAHTVAEPEHIDEELQYLLRCL